VVVAVMGATELPDVGNGPASSDCGTAGEIAMDTAFVVAHVMVDVWPLFTSVGLALNWVIWGTIGAAVTDTASVLVAVVPSDEVAVRVKVVVALIGTIADPEVGNGPVPPPVWGTAGAIVIDVALVVAQVIVDVWPAVTAVGEALNWVIWGTIFCGVTVVLMVLHPSCANVSSKRPKPNLPRYA
jgi:hypothetical protein